MGFKDSFKALKDACHVIKWVWSKFFRHLWYNYSTCIKQWQKDKINRTSTLLHIPKNALENCGPQKNLNQAVNFTRSLTSSLTGSFTACKVNYFLYKSAWNLTERR